MRINMAYEYRLLRNYREKHGIPCAELARRIGIAEPTMRSLENGTRAITPERAKLIEEVTSGELTRQALLPDVFGPAPSNGPDQGRAAA